MIPKSVFCPKWLHELCDKLNCFSPSYILKSFRMWPYLEMLSLQLSLWPHSNLTNEAGVQWVMGGWNKVGLRIRSRWCLGLTSSQLWCCHKWRRWPSCHFLAPSTRSGEEVEKYLMINWGKLLVSISLLSHRKQCFSLRQVWACEQKGKSAQLWALVLGSPLFQKEKLPLNPASLCNKSDLWLSTRLALLSSQCLQNSGNGEKFAILRFPQRPQQSEIWVLLWV